MLQTDSITPAPSGAPARPPQRRYSPVVKVALIGDHELTYRGLATLLSPFADIWLQRYPRPQATHVVTDVALCDTAIDPGVPDLIVGRPGIRTVALFETRPDPARTRRALAAGVSGVLSKSMGAGELHRSLRRLVDGEQVVVGPDRAAPVQGPPGRNLLSPRESEVLSEIVAGRSNDDIAAHLFITANTLKSTIRAAYRKMDVTTRAQAVRWGIEHGYSPGPAGNVPPALEVP